MGAQGPQGFPGAPGEDAPVANAYIGTTLVGRLVGQDYVDGQKYFLLLESWDVVGQATQRIVRRAQATGQVPSPRIYFSEPSCIGVAYLMQSEVQKQVAGTPVQSTGGSHHLVSGAWPGVQSTKSYYTGKSSMPEMTCVTEMNDIYGISIGEPMNVNVPPFYGVLEARVE